MEKEINYGHWVLNTDDTSRVNGYVFNCSLCGQKIVNDEPSVCPSCSAIMVDTLDRTDINGRDICAGDVVLCDIAGYNGRVKGKIIHDTQWYFDNPFSFRFMYDCDNIQIVEGAIPEGKNINREFENTIGKRQR